MICINTGSSGGADIGWIWADMNDLEAIEIDAKGTLFGPIGVSGNRIVDKGSGAIEGPKIRANGSPVTG